MLPDKPLEEQAMPQLWQLLAHRCGRPKPRLRQVLASAVGGGRPCTGATTGRDPSDPMSHDLLLTHHHRHAMANACERGFWMPLAMTEAQAASVSYLTSIHRSSRCIDAIAEITSMERWVEADGIERWLPFMGELVPLLHPVPLGDASVLQGWLPSQREQWQLVGLDQLVQASALSDLLLENRACCPLRSCPDAPASRPADRAA